MADKTVGIFNMSKVGRPYDVPGAEDGQVIRIVAGKVTQVPEKVASWLLGKKPNGAARYSDLCDASTMSPEMAKAKKDLEAENKKLSDENESLRKQLADSNEGKKGGKK